MKKSAVVLLVIFALVAIFALSACEEKGNDKFIIREDCYDFIADKDYGEIVVKYTFKTDPSKFVAYEEYFIAYEFSNRLSTGETWVHRKVYKGDRVRLTKVIDSRDVLDERGEKSYSIDDEPHTIRIEAKDSPEIYFDYKFK